MISLITYCSWVYSKGGWLIVGGKSTNINCPLSIYGHPLFMSDSSFGREVNEVTSAVRPWSGRVAESVQTLTSFPITLMTWPLRKTSDQRVLTHKSAASEGLFLAKASYVFLVTGETWQPHKLLNFPSGYTEVTYGIVLQGDHRRESLEGWFLLKCSKWQTSWPR